MAEHAMESSGETKSTMSAFRRRTLEHIRRVNDGLQCGARCPFGEMIEEAEAAAADGLAEWKGEGADAGRWLTAKGRAALAVE